MSSVICRPWSAIIVVNRQRLSDIHCMDTVLFDPIQNIAFLPHGAIQSAACAVVSALNCGVCVKIRLSIHHTLGGGVA